MRPKFVISHHHVAINLSVLDFPSMHFCHITNGLGRLETAAQFAENSAGGILTVLRLDYLSCVLTIASTILVGRRCWEGWALAGVNSILICVIGLRTAQMGFIPANVFCMAVSAVNLRKWRNSELVDVDGRLQTDR
jgi:hypothetical protein